MSYRKPKNNQNRTKQNMIRARTRSSVSDVKAEMRTNAEAYVATLFDPWGVRGCRFPEESPFPSTTGSYVKRYSPLPIEEKKNGVATGRYWIGMIFGHDYCNNGLWTATLTALDYDLAGETWTPAEHPVQAEFAANFVGIRRVSMGIKVVNTTALVDRAGPMYVSYTLAKYDSQYLETLTSAVETEVYDAAHLDGGLSAVYLPVSSRPMNMNADTISLPACSYMSPGATHGSSTTIVDMNIVVWIECKQADTELIIEQVDNYEAIPYPGNEFMFEREVVKSSPEIVAEAMDVAAPTTTAVSTTSTGQSFGQMAKGALKNVAGFALKQVSSVAMRGLLALPGLLGLADWRHHQIAVLTGHPECSPLNAPCNRGLKREEFVRILANSLWELPEPVGESSVKEQEAPVIIPRRGNK